MRKIVKHGKVRHVTRASIPSVRVPFEVEGQDGGGNEKAVVVMDLAVASGSGPDYTVEASVMIDGGEESREMCVGLRQDGDESYQTATPEAVKNAVSDILTDRGILPSDTFLSEVEAAALEACRAWYRVTASMLADRLVSVCSRDAAVDAVDAAVVREVMSS